MAKERRYDIDWIRVIVFDILILYHIGMFFVPWEWELKNNETIEWLQWPMLFINRWRLPILFVISGMGTRFALSHRTGQMFAKERLMRLLVPLVVGMLLIVAPQIYLVRLSQGATYTSFLEFYPHFFEGAYPEGNFTWAHLWFLPYLLLMSLVFIPLFLYLRKKGNSLIIGLKSILEKFPLALYVFVLPLFLVEAFMSPHFPITNGLFGDWYALALYSVFFISGFILVCCGNPFWVSVKRIRFIAFVLGIVAFTVMVWSWGNAADHYWNSILASINAWTWILTVFGFASMYLNKESRIVKYRNKAVYPFYIFHQTVILLFGFYLMDSPMNVGWKALIMVVGTFAICWAIYELVILRITIIQPMFGVKREPTIKGKRKWYELRN